MKQCSPDFVKMRQNQKKLFYVLYDSITNSVFNGQVLQPLLKKVENDQSKQIKIISFEHRKFSDTDLNSIVPQNKISIIILKKIPYIGIISLFYAATQLKKILKNYNDYQLIARGPLAAMICRYAFNRKKCSSFIVQARGLMAQEYAYAMTDLHKQNRFKKSLFKFRLWQLDSIEKKAYRSDKQNSSITIEAVSKALKEYLITTFNTERETIQVAQNDIPEIFTKEQCAQWKETVRKELTISKHAKVYCYNGSLKPWQCPHMVIQFFKEKYAQDTSSFLLILTQDILPFKELLLQSDIPQHTCHVMQVNHHDIYRYLAACDVGLLFREPHIVNWVSRPTKALEYQAVHLKVAHNNTVAWLM